MALSTVLAKALFDNAAESPEELAFRKGDILMVLEPEHGGGPGWWLCSLHGRQGIAPANRLRLLQTAASPAPNGTDPRRAPGVGEESVYLSPPGPLARTAVSTEDMDGVYLTPPSLGGDAMALPGELRRAEGGRPRSRSSSGTRPRPDWGDAVGVAGRPRSPSLRGRGTDAGAGTLYQTPTTPLTPLVTLTQHHRTPGGLGGAESVYLAPSGVPRAAEGGLEDTYLVPRDTVAAAAGHMEDCYLVPRGMVMPSEDVYQTPTGGAAGVGVSNPATPAAGARVHDVGPGSQGSCGSPSLANRTPLLLLTPQSKPAPAQQETLGMYQTPTAVGAGLLHRILPQNDNHETVLGFSPALGSHKQQAPSPSPAQGGGSPRPQPKGVLSIPSTPPVTRGKLTPASSHRGSPLLARAGQSRGVPAAGSPNFARKPPPPAPPVRGVTRKDVQQQQSVPSPSTGVSSSPHSPQAKEERTKEEKKLHNGQTAQRQTGENRENEDPHDDDDQVYDTPPTSRWQRTAPSAVLCDEEENIYNTPRALAPQADQESEVYDVPTITLNVSSDLQQQQTYNVSVCGSVDEAEEEDVYSVPTLPGLPMALGDLITPILPEEETEHGQVYSVPGPGKRAPLGGDSSDLGPQFGGDSSEPDSCGIYDMPAALTLDTLPSSSSSSSSLRRLSVSSNGSGDVQWRTSLSGLVQTALSSLSASSVSSRDLAASLAEILSVWKATSAAGDPPLPLQQAWVRLSDLLPALSACGNASPSDSLLASVQRALEDTAVLFQTQVRPRLPSQDSLSRRPLPALPVTDGKPAAAGGMGTRKGSWIQERPLPPTPQPAFPLPPAPPSVTLTVGHQSDGEEELGNEYAGISLTPIPASLPVGDSVGYVKLQGLKPEPLPDAQTENGQGQTVHHTEPRSSPSPLPVSLSLEDSELLSFYSSQSLAHLSCLADSIDVLFSSVQGNQPPRVFVSRGKSLIVTAHKLVFIGDTLSRLLTSPDLRAKVTTSGGRLCQALKAVVVATKGAAQNYPSVSATQEMVDRVAQLSQHAAGFSGLLQRLSEIS